MSRAIGESGPPLLKEYREKKPPKGLSPLNKDRKAAAFARNYGPHAEFLRTHRPCVVAAYVNPELRSKCWGPREVAHRECRQRGGCGADWRRTFTACRGHHHEQEGKTPAFEAHYGIDLRQIVELEILSDPNLEPEEYDAAEERLEALRRELPQEETCAG